MSSTLVYAITGGNDGCFAINAYSVDALSSRLEYTISADNSEGKIALGASSGQITLMGGLNYIMSASYTFVHDSACIEECDWDSTY